MRLWIISFVLSSAFFSLNAQEAKDSIQVQIVLQNCQDTVRIFQFDGLYFKQLVAFPPANAINLKMPSTSPRFYYIGSHPQNQRPIVLGEENGVKLTANCKAWRSARIENSAINSGYQNVINQSKSLIQQTTNANRKIQSSRNNPEALAEAKAILKRLDDRRLFLLDSLKNKNSFLHALFAVDGYVSFQNHPGDHPNEVDHFAKTYFARTDLKNPHYANIPYLYEGFKRYTTTLASVKLPREQLLGILEVQLKRIPQQSRAHKYAMAGATIALQSKHHPAFTDVGKTYLQLYGEDNHPSVKALAAKVKASEAFAVGAIAPDFKQKNPEGNEIALSDLKGKVVLVDFWASWCGPCRRENPNVKKLYDKYKDQGFEILGVSLDRKKESWLAAIKKDELPWYHVSDLKGWKNEVAQQYGVTSIPHTVLLDKEGKIVARNLRSHQLEGYLQKLFN